MTRKGYVILCLLASPFAAFGTLYLLDVLGLKPGSRSGEWAFTVLVVPIFVLVVAVGLVARRTPGEVAAALAASIATTLGGGFLVVLILLSSADLN